MSYEGNEAFSGLLSKMAFNVGLALYKLPVGYASVFKNKDVVLNHSIHRKEDSLSLIFRRKSFAYYISITHLQG